MFIISAVVINKNKLLNFCITTTYPIIENTRYDNTILNY